MSGEAPESPQPRMWELPSKKQVKEKVKSQTNVTIPPFFVTYWPYISLFIIGFLLGAWLL